MRLTPFFLLLAACQHDVAVLDVGAYEAIDNQSDAKMIVDEDASAGPPSRVELDCPAHTRATLDALVDEDGTLVITADGDVDTGDCFVHVPASGIRSIVVRGDGDLSSDAVFTDLVSLDVRGSGAVELWAVHNPRVAITVSGNGDVSIADLVTEDVAFDLRGNGTTEVAGSTEHADLSLSGSGVFLGADFLIEDLDADISGNATAEVTVTGSAEVAVSGSATVSVGGGGEVFPSVTGNGSITVF